MRKISIVIIVHNEKEEFELCLQSLNLFSKEISMKVIVVDNGILEEDAEEIKAISDIEYIKMKEQMVGYGEILHHVFSLVKEESDLLIMTPRFLFTQGCVLNLQKAFRDERIGLVAPVCNGFYGRQRVTVQMDDYGQAIDYTNVIRGKEMERVVGVDPEFFLVKWEVLSKIEGADEQFISISKAVFDLQMQIIKQKYQIVVCHDAFIYCMKQISYDNLYARIQGGDQDNIRLKQKWGMNYFNMHPHESILKLIDDRNRSMNVLEIGCDCGANLLGIRHDFPDSKLYGVEINESAADIARNLIENIEIENIEAENLKYEEGMFDYIIFGDVLEHLSNPLKCLCYCKKFLNKNGYILSSIPNFMHISVIEGLLNGMFTYTDNGIMDKTHIHMFTYYEIINIFSQAGYSIDKVELKLLGVSENQKKLIGEIMPLTNNVETFMFEAYQFIIRAKRGG